MSSFKNLAVWVAPTSAVVLSGVLLVSTGVLSRDAKDATSNQASAVPQPAVAAPVQTNVPTALIATDTNVVAKDQLEGLQIIDAIKQAKVGANVVEVTKDTPISVLEPLTPEQPLSEPVVVATVPETVDSSAAANFFANAQANLAAEDFCADDLRALAETTSIYFPEGGVSAEDAGLIQGRVIGQIAGDCTGYTLEVRGHSDPSGNAQLNLALSQRRAEAVIALLASSGVDTSSFIPVGMGSAVPSNLEGPKGSAYYDRRVDFTVVKAETRTASLGAVTQPWQTAPTTTTRTEASSCAVQLEQKVASTRLFYGTRAITVSPSELEAVYELADAVNECDGARLRVVGQHSDQAGDRESVETGRLRALVLMGSLVSAGFDSERILIGALSYAADVPGQPGLPKSRVDFQVIMD